MAKKKTTPTKKKPTPVKSTGLVKVVMLQDLRVNNEYMSYGQTYEIPEFRYKFWKRKGYVKKA